MARRAQELQRIEATYLGESMTKPKPAPRRVTPKFASTQQAHPLVNKEKVLDLRE